MSNDDDLTPEKVWSILSQFINVDELADEIALACGESRHAKRAYELLRQASGDTIQPLQGRLRLINARNARP